MATDWKPDFTQPNPYEGMPAEYAALVAETFVPTEVVPLSPIEVAIDVGWLPEDTYVPPVIPPVIPPPVIPPPAIPPLVVTPVLPSVKFLDSIFSWVWDFSIQLRDWADDIWAWIPLNEWFHDRLYNIADWLWKLLTPIAHFGDWVNDVAAKIASLGSPVDIIALLRTWLDYAENAWSWISNAWQNVTSIINIWWSSASQAVHVWVNEAKQYAASLYATLQQVVSGLQVAWDAFKSKIPSIDAVVAWWGNWSGNVLSVINSWWTGALLQVQSLINSAFIIRESLWAGWQDWRDQVVEFFPNPLEFLWTKFADWFLGPEV